MEDEVVDYGDEEEHDGTGKKEACDYGAAETLPERIGESDGDEADDGTERGECDGFEAAFGSIGNGFSKRQACFEVLIYFVNNEDRILNNDTEEGEYSN